MLRRKQRVLSLGCATPNGASLPYIVLLRTLLRSGRGAWSQAWDSLSAARYCEGRVAYAGSLCDLCGKPWSIVLNGEGFYLRVDGTVQDAVTVALLVGLFAVLGLSWLPIM